MIFFLWFVGFASAFADRERAASASLVNLTSSGVVLLGRRVSVAGVGAEAFRFSNIRYATPPTGPARFRYAAPLGVTPGDVIDATNATALSCVNFGSRSHRWSRLADDIEWGDNMADVWGNEGEDCLVLNVWTPVWDLSKPPRKKFSVMVEIHGGSYYGGSGSQRAYDGSVLASVGGVVVVTLNYRLGPLGFLYLGIPGAMGNQGLHDQYLALQWVRNHIHLFHGDADSVTIVGESAGAGAAHLHLLSPISRSLFKRAILSSGSVNRVWSYATPGEALASSKSFAEMFCEDCGGRPRCILDCLRDDELWTLDFTKSMPYISSNIYIPFVPVVDDFFVVGDPEVSRTYAPEVEVLLGWCSKETLNNAISQLAFFEESNPGGGLLGGVGSGDVLDTRFREETYRNASVWPPIYAHYFPRGMADIYARWRWGRDLDGLSDERLEVLLRLQRVFHGEKEEGELSEAEAFDMNNEGYDDVMFICPMIEIAEDMAKREGVKVYVYEFDHNLAALPSWMRAHHGTHLPLLFGRVLDPDRLYLQSNGRPIPYSDADQSTSRLLIDEWTNFVKTGAPSSEWRPFTSRRPLVRVYDADTSRPLRLLPKRRHRRCAFYDDVFRVLTAPGRSKETTPAGGGVVRGGGERVGVGWVWMVVAVIVGWG